MLPATTTDQSDLSIAVAAARAAAAAAEDARGQPLQARAKSVSADLVTDADGKAEAAAVTVLRAHRPDDAIQGEEGADHAGTGDRRWWIDGIDGTVAFASRPDGLVQRGRARGRGGREGLRDLRPGGRRAVRRGPRRGRRDPASARAARWPRRTSPPSSARTGSSSRASASVAHRLLDAAGLLRHAGPGSLELAWVAAGRLDGWIQPDTDPWDWLPGALLVQEAGGVATVVQRETRWHIAGSSALVDELVALLT